MLITFYDDQKNPKGSHRLPFICPLSLVNSPEDCVQPKNGRRCKFFMQFKHEIFNFPNKIYRRASVDCCENSKYWLKFREFGANIHCYIHKIS